MWDESFCRNAIDTEAPAEPDTASTSTSLIPETLQEMSTNSEFQQTAQRLQRLGQAAMTREEKQKRQRSLDRLGVPSFGKMVQVWSFKGCNLNGTVYTPSITSLSVVTVPSQPDCW